MSLPVAIGARKARPGRAVALAAALLGLACVTAGKATAEPAGRTASAPATWPSARDLKGMRLGLMMLGPNAERAFAAIGVDAEPRALTLGQIEALYALLSRSVALGEAERVRVERILARPCVEEVGR